MGAIKKGETRGRVKNVLGVTRMYYKPALGKFVLRKPGVHRRSERVLERNKKVQASPPAPKCKGLPWEKFISCLSKEMPR